VIGMLPYENIQIQLVDLPPLWEESEGWMYNLIRNADLIILFLSMDLDSIVDEYIKIRNLLEGKKIKLVRKNPDRDPYSPIKENRGIVILNKIDIFAPEERKEEIEIIKKDLNVFCVSAEEGVNMEDIKKSIFDALHIVRVYTKKPGYPPDLSKPYILEKGSTVLDVAEMIHKDIAKNLKFAKLYKKDGSVKEL